MTCERVVVRRSGRTKIITNGPLFGGPVFNTVIDNNGSSPSAEVALELVAVACATATG